MLENTIHNVQTSGAYDLAYPSYTAAEHRTVATLLHERNATPCSILTANNFRADARDALATGNVTAAAEAHKTAARAMLGLSRLTDDLPVEAELRLMVAYTLRGLGQLADEISAAEAQL